MQIIQILKMFILFIQAYVTTLSFIDNIAIT